ncbi:PREDICTED: conserved oligomeric Golgi complex subunit 1 [Cyprinodon variegatus]|uniref:conserved oligomeric Golgi complex subunit 1 n=1 Tax=Cyprinodon variegatus TaxID=28743 RepID=UPI000742B37D|nr:PREDICTED: conserved oligomeric Golgi complex subunit 1 [Cyprinodon variegatus]
MMAGDPVLSLRVSDIKDPAALFERYSTEDIRRIERKVCGEIEQKKEELRQMVGERYRDLIDAADTIGEMRQCSGSLVESIQDMQRYCRTLKQSRAGRQENQDRDQNQDQQKFYTMASQIKLLLEIPELIWSSMEASQYLQATQLYLLCCHLQSLLQLEAAGGLCSPVLARFPILVRQVATTGHFSFSKQAGKLEGAGIKAQVCSLVELLVTTLFQAYAVFYLPPEGAPRPAEGALSCGMLFSTLENVTSSSPAGRGRKVLQEEWSAGGWFRHLPPSITEFQPSLRSLAQPILTEQLRDTLQQWINTETMLAKQTPSVILCSAGSRSSSGPPDSSSFNRYTDSPAVEEALREGCVTCVRHILFSIRSELDPAPARLGAVLFMARLCQSLSQLCPSLKQCILGTQSSREAAVSGTPRQGKKLSKSKAAAEVSPEQAKWAGLKEELLGCSMEAYRIWSSALAKGLTERFAAALLAESAGAVLTAATGWEDLEIQEESESGSSVTSKIRLPVQPSWFVQTLLFQLCVEVNRVGGHALPRPTLQELLQACLHQALHHYGVLSERMRDAEGALPVTQNRALQLLFDLRYLNTTLSSRLEEGKTSRSQQDPRFGLLPLSMSNARKSKSSSRASEASQKLAPPSSAAGSDDSFRPGSVFRQMADQDEDAAAPSLFKLSWLAGMAK